MTRKTKEYSAKALYGRGWRTTVVMDGDAMQINPQEKQIVVALETRDTLIEMLAVMQQQSAALASIVELLRSSIRLSDGRALEQAMSDDHE